MHLDALVLWGLLAALPSAAGPGVRPPPGAGPVDDAPAVLLNELDADQSGVDSREFVELLAAPGRDLGGLVVVLYNGAAPGDAAYDAVDLFGQTAGADGLFVLGSPAVDGVDLVAFTSNGIQNGPDGAALWWAPGVPAASFIGTGAATPPAGARLVDALVHGTSDAPDAALLAALTPGGALADESSGPGPVERSLQRRPDGGAPFDTARFIASAPTPGRRNGPLRHLAIHEIQGAGHHSPFDGAFVADVTGVVTAVRADRFHLQSLPGREDDDPATSEALVVIAGGAALPEPGDHVTLSGWVEEHRPGGALDNLTTTRLVLQGDWTLEAAGAPLPAPVTLGAAGRPLPDRVVDDDTRGGRVGEGTTLFDPEADGLDAFEALEGMRVRVDDAVAVSATSAFGEIAVLADGGAGATGLVPRGVLLRGPDDPNPERIVVDDALLPTPAVSAGDRFDAPLVGVLDYSFGSPKLLLTAPARAVPGAPPAERAAEAAPDALRVATLNVQNLSPQSDGDRIADLAATIVHGLGSPDVVALQEVQDGSGPVDDGVLSALPTLMLLQGAVRSQGGPRYVPLEIAPLDGEDGGQPGGNIRVALLYRADGDLRLVSRSGGDAVTPVVVRAGPDGLPHLHPSPGRVAPLDPAFESSRKPLAAEFTWRGRALFVVVVHFSSKLGDTPIFGSWQPPVDGTTAARVPQARAVRELAADLLALDPDAAVVVLGDFNDFEWSATLAEARGEGVLENLTDRLPRHERGSYVFEGNAQTLDHCLVSASLARRLLLHRVVHRHAGRHVAPSDHDPVLADFAPPEAPTGLR